MSQDFLGTGWNFPLSAQQREGDVLSAGLAYHEESIRQAIWLILSTARGERVMRPDFGCGMHNLVFALENASTAGLVQHEVEQALLFWEPRINVIAVKVSSGQAGDDDAQTLAAEYRRYCDTEARLLFEALAYKEKLSIRAEAQEELLKVAGTGPTGAEVAPQEIDAAVLRKISEKKLPSFSRWRKMRAGSPVLLITIDYSVKASNSRFNVVYPFYLERTQP